MSDPIENSAIPATGETNTIPREDIQAIGNTQIDQDEEAIENVLNDD